MSGFVIYRGPSLLDGSPIVAIATTESDNRKTGPMLQTWILRADVSPVEAYHAATDDAICGDCKHRQSTGGACYVNIGQGPRSVWAAWQRGVYLDLTGAYEDGSLVDIVALGTGERVRLGAYGDPAAVPTRIWRALCAKARGHTGYTHQWHTFIAWPLRDLCMASVDSIAEQERAHAMGWRTFRVATESAERLTSEFVCVNTTHGISCADCLACDGAELGRPRKASVVIPVHGALKGRFIAIRPA